MINIHFSIKDLFIIQQGQIFVHCHQGNICGKLFNKWAQKALGRSPEEKVKGHSGAIY